MARPRKKAQDLTTEEALAKLFPKKAVKTVKEETRKADEQAIRKDSKP
jgi:hypothetical protein